MKKYLCLAEYKFHPTSVEILFLNSLGILGFEPNFIDVFFDEFKDPLFDISYNNNQVHAFIKKGASSITIKNKLYNETDSWDFKWFRIKISIDTPYKFDTISLEWSNSDLDFLLTKKALNFYLEFPKLISLYCYDQMDSIEQSNNKKSPENWGKSVNVHGVTFIAAPLMWFGPEFGKVIPLEKLKTYNQSIGTNEVSEKVAYISLFDLYDDPANKNNRDKQMEFWKVFNLSNVISKYENETTFDALNWLKSRSKKNRK